MLERLDDIYKLKNITRYNNRLKIKNESVAEHSFFVALLALDLCTSQHIDNDTTLKILVKSLLHDMPEIEINDITHDAKQKLNIGDILKKHEDEYYKTYYPAFASLMEDNSDNLVNTVVSLADGLSVVQYCRNEQYLGNNSKDIKDILDECTNRVNHYHEKMHRIIEGE